MKYLVYSCLLLAGLTAMAQRPIINTIDKTSATVGEVVTITGTNFPAMADLQVNFGAGVATVLSANATQIRVVVPGNATHAPVMVSDLANRIMASSSELFLLSYSGSQFIPDSTNFNTFNVGQQFTYDLCLCDFDMDGLVDVGVSNNRDATTRGSIFRNQSTLSTTNFTKVLPDLDNAFPSVNTDCGDLNGDGFPDLVFSSSDATLGNHISVWQNDGTGAFTKYGTNLRLNPIGTSNKIPKKIKLADMDGDGRPDIIVGSITDNTVSIFRNISVNNIAFQATPNGIAVSSLNNCSHLDVKDMNNDLLPDIIVTGSAGPIAVLKNESEPNNFNFELNTILDNGNRVNVYAADLNNDGFPEIIATQELPNAVDIYENITSARGLSPAFNANPTTVTVPAAWGITSGDLNGDGLADIVIASTAQPTSSVNGIYVLTNNFDGTNLGFTSSRIPTTQNTRNVKVGDLNGDAKPDLAFTHLSRIDDPGQIGILMNRNCLSPTIAPDLTFCPNSPFDLTTIKSAETTYNWYIPAGTDATITPPNSNDNVEITVNSGASATIGVVITSNYGNCADTVEQSFTVSGTTPPATPVITSDIGTAVCVGEEMTLSGPAGSTEYYWTLPDGTNLTQNGNSLIVSALNSGDAGTYELRTFTTGGCVSDAGTLNINVNEPPFISINNAGQDNFCEGDSTTLGVINFSGFSYKWLDTDTISGETANAYIATATGDYQAVITDGICSNVSLPYTVNEIPPPTSIFSIPDSICVDVPVDFQATSTGSGTFALAYGWDFDNGRTTTGISAVDSFQIAGTYDVVLTTAYTTINNCAHDTIRSIIVEDPPTADFIVEEALEKCPTDSILLTLDSRFSNVVWSTGDNGDSTYAITTTGQNSVDITATYMTSIGCSLQETTTISNFPNSGISILSDEYTITNDSLILTEPVRSLVLGPNANAVQVVSWSPYEILDDTTGTEVTVYPNSRRVFVTLTARDVNDCVESYTLEIIQPLVTPRKSFSPNGDGMGFECWEVVNISAALGCKIHVFDSRGRNLVVASSPFDDDCVWDGTVNGSPAPEGIYYFVLDCEEDDNDRSGSILLGR